MAKTSSMMIKSNGESKHPLFSILGRKTLSLSLLSMMLAIEFLDGLNQVK